MFYPVVASATALVAGGTGAWYVHKKRTVSSTSNTVGTLVDAYTPESVEALIRILDRGKGADDLAQRVERLLQTFPPDERMLRRLSLMQQKYQGLGNAREYSVTLLFAIAMLSTPVNPPTLKRTFSVPDLPILLIDYPIPVRPVSLSSMW